MEHLGTITEVSVTLSGLAGIVGVLVGEHAESLERMWRVRNLILLSLMAFLLSLFPQGASAFDLGSELIWRISSVLLISALLFQLCFAVHSMDRDWRHSYWKANRHLFAFYAIGGILVMSLQFWNIFALQPGSGPIFAGLSWLLVLSSTHLFVLVMRGTKRPPVRHSTV